MTLYENLPESLTIDGVQYPIDTDFRTWVTLYDKVCNGKTDEEKTTALVDFITGAGLPLVAASVEAVMDFFACAQVSQKTGGKGSEPRVFDFVKDSEYIYSAFLEVYRIDLSREKLHWFSFNSLFRSLPEDCQICKIMHYRAVKLSDVPKTQKKFYTEMKERYRLDRDAQPKTLEQRNEEWKRQANEAYRKAKMQMSVLRGNEQPGDD